MRAVSFTEFRKNASGLLSEVESGVALLVLRHGKPIAKIFPASGGRHHSPSWKRAGLRLTTKGASLSMAILEERRREDIF
jgi:antitoxin (DNA-binding transcriptional repressor) of toxin-antitoxin stability system